MITERPGLEKLFAEARACTRTETFSLHGGVSSHEYALYAPATDPSALASSFGRAAASLGLSKTSVDGVETFFDAPEKRVTAGALPPFLRVSLRLEKSALDAADSRLRPLGFDAWSMIAAVSTDQADIRIDLSERGQTLDATLVVTDAHRQQAERWAERQGLTHTADGWVRKWDEKPGAGAGIVLEFRERAGQTTLSLLETRGTPATGDACVPGSPSKTDSPTDKLDKDQIDLFNEMMNGK